MSCSRGLLKNKSLKLDASLFMVLALFTLTIGSGAILSSATTHAEDDSAVDNIAITVPVACSLTPTIDSAHTATISPNTREEGIGLTTLKAICNDSSGYSIYAVGYTNEELGNTDLIGENTNQLIATGTAESGASNPSTWAMKINAVTGTYAPSIENGFGAYRTVPNSWTKVATFNASTDATIGSSIQSTYAAYISGTQAADTYNGKVKYTLVHPASEEPLSPQPSTAGYINYYANASTAVGTMGRQSATDGNTVQLFASNFSRTGYGFAGWSDTYDYATNASANFYGPNEDITVPTGTTANGLSLYAVWIKSEGNLQDSSKTASVCNSLTPATYNNEGDEDKATWSISAGLNSISALTDTRDNQTYAIARLTDSNCWMIENLRLADKDSSNNDIILSSTNTNNPSLPLTNVYDTSTTSNHLSPTSSIAYTADTAPEGWCTTNSAACDDQSRLRTDNTANRVTYTSTSSMSHGANLYSYGNYYNWYSVTAGNGTYSKSSGVTDGDICPVGWHLPTGTGSGEFGLLSNSLGGYKNASNVARYMSGSTTPTSIIMDERLRHFPVNFLYSGSVFGASVGSRGSTGDFWSSSAGPSNTAYTFYFGYSGVDPGSGTIKEYYGRTARCVVVPSS